MKYIFFRSPEKQILHLSKTFNVGAKGLCSRLRVRRSRIETLAFFACFSKMKETLRGELLERKYLMLARSHPFNKETNKTKNLDIVSP